MKRKVLLFGLSADDVKKMSAFPGSSELDLMAAMSRQQLVEVLSVTAVDLVVVQLSVQMMQRYGNALSALLLNCDKLVVLNQSGFDRSKVSLLFGETPIRIFDQSDLIGYWNFMLERIAKWNHESQISLRKKMALLIDSEPAITSPFSLMLLRNNFDVVYSAFSTADDELLENQYDLVIAKVETPDGTEIPALDPAKRGFNKNTPFLFISKKQHYHLGQTQVFNSVRDLTELEVCVKKYSAA